MAWIQHGTVAAKRAGSIPGGRFVGINGGAGGDARPDSQYLPYVLAGEGAIHLHMSGEDGVLLPDADGLARHCHGNGAGSGRAP
jgi:hypothetical protein